MQINGTRPVWALVRPDLAYGRGWTHRSPTGIHSNSPRALAKLEALDPIGDQLYAAFVNHMHTHAGHARFVEDRNPR